MLQYNKASQLSAQSLANVEAQQLRRTDARPATMNQGHVQHQDSSRSDAVDEAEDQDDSESESRHVKRGPVSEVSSEITALNQVLHSDGAESARVLDPSNQVAPSGHARVQEESLLAGTAQSPTRGRERPNGNSSLVDVSWTG